MHPEATPGWRAGSRKRTSVGRKQRLTAEQERQQTEGLRILARIIARHYFAHPEFYAQRAAEDGPRARTNGDGPARDGEAQEGGAA